MRKVPEFFVAVVLALLFAAALIYLTIEIPRVIHEYLLKVFPDYWWWPPPENIESLRPFGYVLFVATLILMFAGFVAERGRLTALGSIALYLPTFGYFAYTMFSLAGIGILRVLWTPLFDLSPYVLRFGDIVYLSSFLSTLPLAPIFWITGVSGTDMYIPLSFVIMALGLVVLLLGPENGKEIVYVIVVYGIMLIVLSLPSIFLFNF